MTARNGTPNTEAGRLIVPGIGDIQWGYHLQALPVCLPRGILAAHYVQLDTGLDGPLVLSSKALAAAIT